ncbi:hypothetical protein [Collimonas sp.]|jgi:hypothetical protein|uniref:hypothetical protein n=1 Tax=Collimonas sp. TaxID=1963772 RepID=UPI002BD30536|nr:hypothetical protein [Collimonas sp.]HWW04229.1 hypothetical protein [Collimonas sp.]
MSLNACSSDFVTWQEEVKFNDGRVITVTQKKHVDGGMAREAWLTINLPELSPQPIVWHGHLDPMVLNIYEGKLYVVGMPPTQREFEQLGSPRPPYLGYIWGGGQWKRLQFSEIPVAIYDANMLLEGLPPAHTKLVTLAQKEKNALGGYSWWQKRIDANATGNFY